MLCVSESHQRLCPPWSPCCPSGKCVSTTVAPSWKPAPRHPQESGPALASPELPIPRSWDQITSLLRFPSPVPPPATQPPGPGSQPRLVQSQACQRVKGRSLRRESGNLGSSLLGRSQGVVPAEVAFWESFNLERQGRFRGWLLPSLLSRPWAAAALRGRLLGEQPCDRALSLHDAAWALLLQLEW